MIAVPSRPTFQIFFTNLFLTCIQTSRWFIDSRIRVSVEIKFLTNVWDPSSIHSSLSCVGLMKVGSILECDTGIVTELCQNMYRSRLVRETQTGRNWIEIKNLDQSQPFWLPANLIFQMYWIGLMHGCNCTENSLIGFAKTVRRCCNYADR